jgi:hypothetical protein
MRKFYALLTFLFLGCCSTSLLAQSSVLSKGACYRLAVTESGVYALSGTFLQEQGISLDKLQPGRIGVFGYGGGMLPQPLTASRYEVLPQSSVQLLGLEDGRFDPEDQLVFFAQGPHEESYRLNEEGSYGFHFQKNLYSDTAYYFLCLEADQSLTVEQAVSAPRVSPLIETGDAYVYHEEDQTNVLSPGSGREWYGEVFFNGDRQSFPLPLEDALAGTEMSLRVDLLGRTTVASYMEVSLDGNELGRVDLRPILGGRYTEVGKEENRTFRVVDYQGEDNPSLTFSYRSSGGRGQAHLNRFILEYRRKLVHREGFMTFRSTSAPGGGTFRVLSADTDARIWDISDPLRPKAVDAVYRNGAWEFGASADGSLHEYVIFSAGQLPAPQWQGLVAPQDIRSASVPELLIVSSPELRSEAEALAGLRRSHDGLAVKVVTTAQVYNEFSSGRQDVTAIRDYVKWLYDRQPGRLRHLLLFGKGSYDYRGRLDENHNLVPTYQSRNSLHPIYSFPSDDYFGFLEDEEGAWKESFNGDHTLDIGVGRLPVKNPEEAQAVVDKLSHYAENPATLGEWRTRLAFLADDGDNNRYQRDAEELTTSVAENYGRFVSQKIYLDAFPQQRLPNQQLAPEANEAIDELISKGALIVNYIGHGNELRLADENILNVGMIDRWQNLDRLPFFVTATCEFGRHDDPGRVSGAERLVLSPQGGAVGLVTTARPVFSNTNFLLSQSLYRHIFSREDGRYLRLGEIFRRTKNDALSGRDNRNFILLGDPSMRLAYPRQEVRVDSVFNISRGRKISEDTLKALATIRLYGSISRSIDGEPDDDFEGEVILNLNDKPLQEQTLGDESSRMQFERKENVIQRSRAGVRNGRFVMEFVVPKNIIYRSGNARLNFYALNTESGEDAAGLSGDLRIGGSERGVKNDDIPPQIRLYMDDSTFINGGLTAERTRLLARLWDEQGINLSRQQAGQLITARLRKRENPSFNRSLVLNDFFRGELDNYRGGGII